MMELLLLKTRPRCIAEFGSGRSTSVLAGYAHTRGADFFSFEDNAAFVRRVRAGLHGALLPSHYVHHAKITADRWYDVGIIKRTMTNPPDLLFIDGHYKRFAYRVGILGYFSADRLKALIAARRVASRP